MHAAVSCIFDLFHHFALCLNVIQNFVVNFTCLSLSRNDLIVEHSIVSLHESIMLELLFLRTSDSKT